MIIITDLLREPFDEGAKISVKYLVENIGKMSNPYVISLNSSTVLSCVKRYFQINKLLINRTLFQVIRSRKSSVILYIPEASATLFSIIRAKILNKFTAKKVFILALQPRKYSFITLKIIRYISPEILITPSFQSASYLSSIGVKNITLPLGVDNKKYCAFSKIRKKSLREIHNISYNSIVLLHVGHIQESRNLDWFVQIKADFPEVVIIILESTYMQANIKLDSKLECAGIRIVRGHISNMEEWYNLADYYIFPVLQRNGAIETPLSVLEAMACNLPIITTKFGSLVDTFKEDNDFYYINSVKEIIEIIQKQRNYHCNNRIKVNSFVWKETVKKLIDIVD